MSKYPDTDSISCPSMLYVPDEAVSTLPPITPVPGKEGATGETGKNVSVAVVVVGYYTNHITKPVPIHIFFVYQWG